MSRRGHPDARCEFVRRVPSDALLLRRAFSDDRVGDFVPQSGKVLIGVRPWKSIDCLFIKMSRKKNLAGGCILRRPCLCGDPCAKARALSPQAIWPVIDERVSSGDLVFAFGHATTRIIDLNTSKLSCGLPILPAILLRLSVAVRLRRFYRVGIP